MRLKVPPFFFKSAPKTESLARCFSTWPRPKKRRPGGPVRFLAANGTDDRDKSSAFGVFKQDRQRSADNLSGVTLPEVCPRPSRARPAQTPPPQRGRRPFRSPANGGGPAKCWPSCARPHLFLLRKGGRLHRPPRRSAFCRPIQRSWPFPPDKPFLCVLNGAPGPERSQLAFLPLPFFPWRGDNANAVTPCAAAMARAAPSGPGKPLGIGLRFSRTRAGYTEAVPLFSGGTVANTSIVRRTIPNSPISCATVLAAVRGLDNHAIITSMNKKRIGLPSWGRPAVFLG